MEENDKLIILPAKDLTARLSERMVEMDILEVDYDALLRLAISGSSHIDPVSGYGPHDEIAGGLESLTKTYPKVGMHQVPLEQIDGLHDELVGMAVVIRNRVESCGVNFNDSEGYYPISDLREMLDSGDLVIRLED